MKRTVEEEHLYAQDKNGKWHCALTSNRVDNIKYVCDCPDQHKLKLVKCKKRNGKRHFRDYFAHVAKKRKEKDGRNVGTCRGYGEPIEIRNAKHKLRSMCGNFFFTTKKCIHCAKKEYMLTNDGKTIDIQPVVIGDKWKLDCVLKKEKQIICSFEIAHKSYVPQNKLVGVHELGIKVVEFALEEVQNMQRNQELRNIMVYLFECEDCRLRDMLEHEKELLREYEMSRLNEIENEINIILNFESKVLDKGYAMHALYSMFLLESKNKSDIEKAILFLEKYGDSIFVQNNKFIGKIYCHVLKKTKNGIIVMGPESKLVYIHLFCLRFSSEEEHQIIKDTFFLAKRAHDITRDYVMFVNCSSILYTGFKILSACLNFDDFELKDWKWSMLKRNEENYGECARCGFKGHESQSCKKKFCTRCFRFNHSSLECFSKCDRNGNYIHPQNLFCSR